MGFMDPLIRVYLRLSASSAVKNLRDIFMRFVGDEAYFNFKRPPNHKIRASSPRRLLFWFMPWQPPAPSPLARIVGIHLGANVLVADIHLVDQLELLDGLLLFAHLFQNTTQRVDRFLLLLVEHDLFLDRHLERPRRQVIQDRK